MTLFANRYQPLRLIGSGGFGRVFAVIDQKTGETKAFKWLNGATKETRENAQKEFALLKSLRHPHIAQIYEMGFSFEKGLEQTYLVSEWVDGTDLVQAASELNAGEFRDALIQALQALAYLHENGILHGDLKPQNLLIAKNKTATTLKMIDFGLSHFSDENLDICSGTLEYMAPEIFSENLYSPQTDLYALGISFYKALTGKFPEHDDDTNLAYDNEPHASAMMGIIAKMIFADPKQRYACAEDVLQDLELSADREISDTSTTFLHISEPYFLRHTQKECWYQFYEDRFFAPKPTTSPVVVIWGSPDAGLNRFLQDILQTAAIDLVPTIPLQEFQNLSSFEELPERALVWAENTNWDEETISYYETFFAERNYLFVTTHEKKNKFLATKQQIHLGNWSETETGLYLAKACGQKHLPPNLVKTFFEKTNGAPLLLERALASCFAKGYLRFENGKWSDKVVADLCGLVERFQDDLESQNPTHKNPLTHDGHGVLLSEEKLIEKANHRRQNGLLDEAKRLLLAVLENYKITPQRRAQLILEVTGLELETGQIQAARERVTVGLCRTEFSGEARILAFELLAICDFREHRFESAATILKEALDLYERSQLSQKALEISLKSRLAHALWNHGNKVEAEELLQKAWSSWQNQLTLEEKRQTLKINIDELYYQKGDYKKALACLQEHFEIVESYPHLEAYPITLYKMARIHLKLKHWETAEEQLLLSLSEMKKRRALQWLPHVYNELGILYKKQGDKERALENYRHAFELQRIYKKDITLFLIAQNIASLNLETQNEDAAKKYFLYAERHLQHHLQNTMAQRSLAICHLGLCQIEMQRRSFAFAHLHLQNAYKCLQKFKIESLWQTHWQLKGSLDFAENNILALQEDLAKLKHLQSLETFDHDNFTKWHSEIWGQSSRSAP